jgi:hypothetical protein
VEEIKDLKMNVANLMANIEEKVDFIKFKDLQMSMNEYAKQMQIRDLEDKISTRASLTQFYNLETDFSKLDGHFTEHVGRY